MDLTRITRKYEADKLILLGLFIVGLLIARQLSWSRYSLPRKIGQKVISEIKAEGISNLLDGIGRENFYLVKNTRGSLVGFAIDILTDTVGADGIKIDVAGHFYLRKRSVIEHMMAFKSDDDLENFSWKTRLLGPGICGATEVRLDENGMLTVGTVDSNDQRHSFNLTSPAIPEIMIDFVVSRMQQNKQRRITVEVISFDGIVKPMTISQVEKHLIGSNNEVGYLLELPDENRVSKLLYLNDQGRITRIEMQQEGLILERSSAEAVLSLFPNQAGYILQRKEIPQHNQPTDVDNE